MSLILDNAKARLEKMGFVVEVESEASRFLELGGRRQPPRIRVSWERASAVIITKFPEGESPGEELEDVLIRDVMMTFGGLMQNTRKMLEKCHAWMKPREGPSGPSKKLVAEIEWVLGKRVYSDEELEEEGSTE